MSTPLKVLTYNIHKGFSTGNTRFVLHQIRDAIERVDVDLVFLQEIQGEHTQHANRVSDWPRSPQFEFLADKLWPHYAYGKNAVYTSGHHGNAILSKYPILHWENINVSNSRLASRSLLHAVIKRPADEPHLHVFCIHLALGANARRRQLRQLVQRIQSHVPEHAPLVVAGDFNDWLGQAEHSMHKRLGLRDVFLEMTGERVKSFPVWYPVLPVDRIYFRNLQPRFCTRYADREWRHMSDHAALHADFEVCLT